MELILDSDFFSSQTFLGLNTFSDSVFSQIWIYLDLSQISFKRSSPFTKNQTNNAETSTHSQFGFGLSAVLDGAVQQFTHFRQLPSEFLCKTFRHCCADLEQRLSNTAPMVKSWTVSTLPGTSLWYTCERDLKSEYISDLTRNTVPWSLHCVETPHVWSVCSLSAQCLLRNFILKLPCGGFFINRLLFTFTTSSASWEII